jgi:hypothetical protein
MEGALGAIRGRDHGPVLVQPDELAAGNVPQQPGVSEEPNRLTVSQPIMAARSAHLSDAVRNARQSLTLGIHDASRAVLIRTTLWIIGGAEVSSKPRRASASE